MQTQYQSQEIWFGDVYDGVSYDQREQAVRLIGDAFRTDKKNLERKLGGSFEKNTECLDEMHEYVKFPIMNLESVSVKSKKIDPILRIRMNVCSSPHQIPYYCKIWSIFGNNGALSHEETKDFFEYSKNKHDKILPVIEDLYFSKMKEAFDPSLENGVRYSILIKSFGSVDENARLLIEKSKDAKELKELLARNKMAENYFIDFVDTVYNKRIKKWDEVYTLTEKGEIKWRIRELLVSRKEELLPSKGYYTSHVADASAEFVSLVNQGELEYMREIPHSIVDDFVRNF